MPLLTKRRVFKLVTLILSLAFGLLVCEVALRLVGYSQPDFYRPSETLGYELTPGISGWYTKEGRSWVEINNDGARDVEWPLEKPADAFRVAVVGDSYVEALQVERSERFTEFLGHGLRGSPALNERRVEILSFGVSGYGTAQELLLAREKVWKYEPDLVLLLITTNNDVTDNLRDFKGTPIPYFVLKNGAIELDNSFRDDAKFRARSSYFGRLGVWLRNHLRTVQGIGALTKSIKEAWNSAGQSKQPAAAPTTADQDVAPAGDVGIDNEIYRAPSDDKWREAWTVTEDCLKLFDREAREHNAKLVVATGSNGIQVWPQVEGRDAFARRLGVADLLYPDRRIAEFCKANSIGSITLVDELAAYAAERNVYLHGFPGDIGNGHWNQTGHRVAGELIARHLREMLETN